MDFTPGGSSVDAYFPAGQWYEWDTFKLFSANGKETKTIDTPRDHLPVSYFVQVYTLNYFLIFFSRYMFVEGQ